MVLIDESSYIINRLLELKFATWFHVRDYNHRQKEKKDEFESDFRKVVDGLFKTSIDFPVYEKIGDERWNGKGFNRRDADSLARREIEYEKYQAIHEILPSISRGKFDIKVEYKQRPIEVDSKIDVCSREMEKIMMEKELPRYYWELHRLCRSMQESNPDLAASYITFHHPISQLIEHFDQHSDIFSNYRGRVLDSGTRDDILKSVARYYDIPDKFGQTWGIVIKKSGLLSYALCFFMEDDEYKDFNEAVKDAFIYLFYHEYFHYIADVMITEMELICRQPILSEKYLTDFYNANRRGSQNIDDGMAEAYAFNHNKKLKLQKEKMKEILQRPNDWENGYNHFERYLGKREFGNGVRELLTRAWSLIEADVKLIDNTDSNLPFEYLNLEIDDSNWNVGSSNNGLGRHRIPVWLDDDRGAGNFDVKFIPKPRKKITGTSEFRVRSLLNGSQDDEDW